MFGKLLKQKQHNRFPILISVEIRMPEVLARDETFAISMVSPSRSL
jgi:hypothetical protein